MPSIPTPSSHNMQEHPDGPLERLRLSSCTISELALEQTPLSEYIKQGMAYTVGSALGFTPPTIDECLAAFVLSNKAGLTAGSRAWSKHAHRSLEDGGDPDVSVGHGGWWGVPSGPVAHINEKSLQLFWRVMNAATWRNLHWLPHKVLVYEVRVQEGYGMRWSQTWVDVATDEDVHDAQLWVFRGFVEPMMDNGHEVGWKH